MLAFEYLKEKDIIFRQIIDLYGLPEMIPSRPEGFQTLVLLILEQQVSVDSAKATFLRLKEKFKEITPENLLNTPEEDFRNCGVSRQKSTYINHLAEAISTKKIDLETLSTKPAESVRNELIKLKGIGHWTIDIYLIFSLNKPDVLPIGDIAIINTLKELLELKTKEEIILYTQNWSPYRSYASFLLWHYYLQKRGRKITYDY
ncbi:DNA-3-methyladenine glycosylase family protein [Flavobacterium oreochromis]|uniref:DNA-3-methyladenine glycosylase family protein n=1 Tax=Flavobacterium oreochromis TaxID=2906078 RepID=UPI000B4D8033|nr:DNA-3-methyladenine glycosylase [Flavobacterium oreochromis]